MSDQPPPDEHADATSQPPEPPRPPLTQTLGRVLIGVLVVLFGVFAVANAQPVDFSWLFGETQVEIDPTGERVSGGVPLIVLLIAAFVVGLLVGLILAWQSQRSQRRADRRDGR